MFSVDMNAAAYSSPYAVCVGTLKFGEQILYLGNSEYLGYVTVLSRLGIVAISPYNSNALQRALLKRSR